MWSRKCIFKIIRPTLCYYFTTLQFSYYHKKFVLKLRKISQKHHLAAEFKLWQPFSENQWPCKGSQSLVWGTLHLPDLSLADEESERKFGWSSNLEDGAAALDGVPRTTPMTTALSSPRGGEEGFGRDSNLESLPAAPMTKGLLRCWGRASLAAAPITAWENQSKKKYLIEICFLICCCHHSKYAIITLLTLTSTAK